MQLTKKMLLQRLQDSSIPQEALIFFDVEDPTRYIKITNVRVFHMNEGKLSPSANDPIAIILE